ncbi:hypothetical protein MLD38_024774 [Melastoma candidum]|nr:hypothetical protein MLD38_024774 [Melastoma candidum]
MLAHLFGLFLNWRILAVLGVLPRVILIPGLFFVPESPRWLAKMGMTEEFEVSLQVLRGFDTDISVEVNKIRKEHHSLRRTQTEEILVSLDGLGFLILQQLSGINGVEFYSSTIFESAGVTSSNAATFGLGAVQILQQASLQLLWPLGWLIKQAAASTLYGNDCQPPFGSCIILCPGLHILEFQPLFNF